jgi:hypothetical protein
MNPYARPLACAVCNDIRRVTKRIEARENDIVPCPRCGNFNAEEYERFRMDAWVKDQKPPEISELDLNEKEFVVYQRLRKEHPKVSKLTVLSWMEGQRYEAIGDVEFLKEITPLLKPETVEALRREYREWKART